jgi:hypothetical protein
LESIEADTFSIIDWLIRARQPIHRASCRWRRTKMIWTCPLIAAVVSAAVSAIVSLIIFHKNRVLSVRPILVFASYKVSEKDMWCLYNVGCGPTLEIIFSHRPRDKEDWQIGSRFPPLAPGMYVDCTHGFELGCEYCDVQGRWYRSTCKHFKTTISALRKDTSLNRWLKKVVPSSWSGDCRHFLWREEELIKESVVPKRI